MNRPRATTFAVALMALACAAGRVCASDVPEHVITRDGRSVSLFIDEAFGADSRRDLLAWLDVVANSLLQVYGRWPREHWEIAVTPASAPEDEPIPWAQVRRGEPDSLQFFVAPGTGADTLSAAATGYHEAAHLLIPYRGWGDSWFSEGLASYYQHILQARAGVIDEQALWQAVHDGFRQGREDASSNGETLAEVSDRLREDASHLGGNYMRVYWSGAWYFLKLDTRLRRQSGGNLSLDTALGRLNTCCADRRMSVPEMVAALDRLNEVITFRSLYDQVRTSTSMPDYTALLASLGIAVSADGLVQLQQHGPGAELRRQIAAPPAL